MDGNGMAARLLEEIVAHAERPTGDAAFDRGYIAGLASAALAAMEGGRDSGRDGGE